MKYEKATLTAIEMNEDVIATSAPECHTQGSSYAATCSDAGNQYSATCDSNASVKQGQCTNHGNRNQWS